jgi:predicted enzyme involved in methoxymalonyl-ACP biosynthesis
MKVSWAPKSEAVAWILKTWNIGADSVVFVDDSPLELAEVKAEHPDVECIKFPTKDSSAAYNLGFRLRDLIGESAILQEDTIRAESVRRSHAGVAARKSEKLPRQISRNKLKPK